MTPLVVWVHHFIDNVCDDIEPRAEVVQRIVDDFPSWIVPKQSAKRFYQDRVQCRPACGNSAKMLYDLGIIDGVQTIGWRFITHG